MDQEDVEPGDLRGGADDEPPAPPGFHWLREGERRRYPDYLLPIAGQLVPDDERFAEAREEFLLGYGHQTARAYRADLDDAYSWALRRGFDVLKVSEDQIRQYLALLRRRKYTVGAIRRRVTTLRRLQVVAAARESSGQRLPERLGNGGSRVYANRPYRGSVTVDDTADLGRYSLEQPGVATATRAASRSIG